MIGFSIRSREPRTAGTLVCVQSGCSFVVGAADAREVSVADAGEVACGTPELPGAGRFAELTKRFETSALSSVGVIIICIYVCALNSLLVPLI